MHGQSSQLMRSEIRNKFPIPVSFSLSSSKFHLKFRFHFSLYSKCTSKRYCCCCCCHGNSRPSLRRISPGNAGEDGKMELPRKTKFILGFSGDLRSALLQGRLKVVRCFHFPEDDLNETLQADDWIGLLIYCF